MYGQQQQQNLRIGSNSSKGARPRKKIKSQPVRVRRRWRSALTATKGWVAGPALRKVDMYSCMVMPAPVLEGEKFALAC